MNATPRRLARWTALLLAGVAASHGEWPSNATDGMSGREAVANIREARMRKLHLVRPDLIHYPISFDVVC